MDTWSTKRDHDTILAKHDLSLDKHALIEAHAQSLRDDPIVVYPVSANKKKRKRGRKPKPKKRQPASPSSPKSVTSQASSPKAVTKKTMAVLNNAQLQTQSLLHQLKDKQGMSHADAARVRADPAEAARGG